MNCARKMFISTSITKTKRYKSSKHVFYKCVDETCTPWWLASYYFVMLLHLSWPDPLTPTQLV